MQLFYSAFLSMLLILSISNEKVLVNAQETSGTTVGSEQTGDAMESITQPEPQTTTTTEASNSFQGFGLASGFYQFLKSRNILLGR